jgi:hypothetical protein
MACCLGMTAFISTASVAHATFGWNKNKSKNYCRSAKDCDRGEYCGFDRKCHDRKQDDCCRNSSDCDRREFCGSDRKCHERPDYCCKDSDCKEDEFCGSDKKCHDRPDYCKNDSDCEDCDYCGSDHKCHDRPDECTRDEQCDNDEFCGSDKKCHDRPSCDDGDACTVDTYEGKGRCSHTRIDGCESCSCDADCDDSNPETIDTCEDGICQHDTPAECTNDTQCDDGDRCTTDACADEACTHTAIAGCGSEVCTDGLDNDGDSATDCDDSDCATDASCVPPAPVEICGDCLDNDNNGQTDFEDAACCDASYGMILARAKVTPKGETSRMRIKSTLATKGLSTINPTKQDVFLQIRPAGSRDILCARVPASKFMANKRTFKYWSKMSSAPSAQGLGDMKIKVKKNGSVKLKSVSKKVKLGAASAGAYQITVGFHGGNAANSCSSTMASFGVQKKSLVAK